MDLALSEFNLIAQKGRMDFRARCEQGLYGVFHKTLKPGRGFFLTASVLFLKGLRRVQAKQPLMCLFVVTRGSDRAETVNK